MTLSGESLIIVLGNIGAVVYLGKRVLDKVDRHNDVLPEITASLRSITKSQETMAASIKELYDSRNEHSERLAEIETTHEVKGCKSGGRRNYDPERRQ